MTSANELPCHVCGQPRDVCPCAAGCYAGDMFCSCVLVRDLRAEVEQLKAEVLRLNRVLVRESSGISREFSPELLGRR